MAVRIPVTHGWSRLVAFLKIIAAFVLIMLIIGGAHEIIHYRSDVVDILLLIGIIIFFISFISKFFSALSTLLYVRLTLRTPINYKDAFHISYFFEPNNCGKWYPMRHLLDVPKEIRRSVLFETIDKINRCS